MWKDIPGHSEYRVSKGGQVQSKKSGKWRNIKGMLQGPRPQEGLRDQRRLVVRFYTGGRYDYVDFQISHLVLEAFVGPRPESDGSYHGYTASHKNGKPLDNRASNLCWETQAENLERREEHGTMSAYDLHLRR